MRSNSLILRPKRSLRRKSDQRQFVDRRPILLFGRPQNREMDEIDIGIGLQKIPPHALARVRFPRNEQNLQFVAYALDRQHRLVVDRGQLVRQGFDLDLDDILAAVFDPDRHADAFSGRHGEDSRPDCRHGEP